MRPRAEDQDGTAGEDLSQLVSLPAELTTTARKGWFTRTPVANDVL